MALLPSTNGSKIWYHKKHDGSWVKATEQYELMRQLKLWIDHNNDVLVIDENEYFGIHAFNGGIMHYKRF